MLCQNDRIRICLSDRISEIFPEPMVHFRRMSEIRSHVKTPAIRIIRRRYPFLSDVQYIIVEFTRAFVIQLRQCIMSPPAIIRTVIRPLVWVIKMEIITIWTVSGNISPFWITLKVLIDTLSVHPFIERTAVVEYAV